jgi:hypothetical protein
LALGNWSTLPIRPPHRGLALTKDTRSSPVEATRAIRQAEVGAAKTIIERTAMRLWMLIVGYCFGIRSERRLREDVYLNLAYRWFCRLGLDGNVPDHSTFGLRLR